MKMYFSQKSGASQSAEEDYTPLSLQECIEKTRQALEIAYAGFDNAVDIDLIDSYIYEINSLQKRYKHLMELASLDASAGQAPLRKHSPVRTLVSHVLG